MDAGDIWYHALSSAGRNIASGIEHYQKEADQVNQVDALIKMGSQMQLPDGAGGSQPLISPQMVQMWSQQSRPQKMHSAGAMEALTSMMMGLAHEGAKARLASDALLAKEGLIQRRQMNVAAFKEGLKKRTGASSEFGKALKRYGMTPEDFDRTDPSSFKFVGPGGEPVEHVRFGKDWNIYENLGRPKGGGSQQWVPAKREGELKSVKMPNGVTVPLNQFRSMLAKRQQEQTTPKGNQISAREGIPTVTTVQEAMQYPAGTLVMTPVGIRRVPAKKQGQQIAPAETTDSDVESE